jgi:CrcB protein
MWRLALLFVGGGCGTLLRYWIAGWTQRTAGAAFPIGTLTVNIVGCLLIGFLASLLTGPALIREEYRVAILVGILGGFTTFSTFSHETVKLTDNGQFALAALNVLLSNTLGLAAAWLGGRTAVMIYGT